METLFASPSEPQGSRLWQQVERVERAVDSLEAATFAIVEVKGGSDGGLPPPLERSAQALRPIVVLLASCCARLIGHAADSAEEAAGRSRELALAVLGRAASLGPPGAVHEGVLAVLNYAEVTRRLLVAVHAMQACLGQLDGSAEQLEDLRLIEQEARVGTARTQRLAREASESLEGWRC